MSTLQIDDMLASLRAAGLRSTVQRRIVIAAILEAPRHVTAEAITAMIQAEHPDIAQSTVYRTLEALENQGIVQHAHMGHGPAVYHVGANDHLHLVCESCGKVTEVPDAVYARFVRMLSDKYSFTATPHHFAVHGRCAGCGQEPAEPVEVVPPRRRKPVRSSSRSST